jgi:tryptophan 2,3-dioxygenase
MRLPCGHDVVAPNQVHYCDYLRLADLLSLQPAPEDLRHPDELLFITAHQAFELWFKVILFELDRVMEAVRLGQVEHATWLVRRITAIIRLFIPQITILEAMSPADFFEFRGALSPASGSESQGFREVEVASGVRDPQLRKFLELRPSPDANSPQTLLWTERIARRWEAPSVRELFLDLLHRRGVTVTDLYRPSGQPNPHHDLLMLAEALLDYDEAFANWRFAHARMAERALGAHIPGTGYTSGVPYLDSTVQRPHFFPELWDARSQLWQQRQSAVER